MHSMAYFTNIARDATEVILRQVRPQPAPQEKQHIPHRHEMSQ